MSPTLAPSTDRPEAQVCCKVAVAGMSCSHCVHAITAALSPLDGVTAVIVNLDEGTVVIESTHPMDFDDLRNAVDEAGYEVVS